MWLTRAYERSRPSDHTDPFDRLSRTHNRSYPLDNPNTPTDEELLRRITERELAALDSLYERYGRQAFSLAFRMVASRQTAEEIVQDSFLSVWNNAASYSARVGSVKPWLFTIVHHRALDYLRSRNAKRVTAPLNEATAVATGQDVFSEVYAGVSAESVRSAMTTLPEDQRRAVELFYFGGLTFAEISELLDTPVGTIKSRVRLALGRLRVSLAEMVEL